MAPNGSVMRRLGGGCRRLALILTAACFLPGNAVAHPGSGIVIDRRGQVYFLDTGAGLWKIDAHGVLTRVSQSAFHWMALDASDRFASTRLPSGSDWEIVRAGANPTLLLASDFPLAIGRDGNLYYPTFKPGSGLQIQRLTPSGQTSVLANLPSSAAKEPLRWINGLAAGPDGSLYYTENNAVRRITMQGRISTVVADIAPPGCVAIPGNEGSGPLFRGLDVDSRGTVYVAASGCGSLLRVAPDKDVRVLLQLRSPWSPTAVALSGNHVYVLEYLHTAAEIRRAWIPQVRKISPNGKTTVIARVDRH